MTEKEKYLASAQKFVLKGNLDRAIKDYEQIVSLDPQDLRHRQRLAELLIRVNRKDEAIREFETIGRFYADNAYFLKAIAVYKQIQKLAPQNMEISLLLAELNDRQGLKGNALAEYQRVVLHFESIGENGEAAKVLEKMVAIDQENVAIRLKLAEINLQANFRERAYRELLRSAILLNQQLDEAGFARVCERVREVFPEQTGFIVDLAEEQVRGGQADEAVLFLQALLDRDDTNRAAWFLLAEAYDACGDWENVKDTYHRMTVLFPADLAAREKLIESLIAEENTSEALTNLESCLSFFPSEQVSSFERYFQTIVQLTPLALRPLLGLRTLYEKSGAEDKLAEVEVRLELLGKSHLPEPEGETGEIPDDTLLTAESAPDEATGVDSAGAAGSEVALPEPGLRGEAPGDDGPPEEQDEAVAHEVAAGDSSPASRFLWEEEIELSLEDHLPDAGGVAVSGIPAPVSGGEVPAADDAIGFPLEFLPSATTPATPPAEEDFVLDLSEARESHDFLDAGFPEIVIDVEPEQTHPEEPFLPDDVPENLFAALDDDRRDDRTPEAEGAEPGAAPPAAARPGKYSIDGQFSEFKKGLDRQIDREDTETHYNLGIAYKEMGLYRDAIEELQIVARFPQRRVDALILQGICLRECGEPGRAREMFLSVLNDTVASKVDAASARYELALLQEEEGDLKSACTLYREIWSCLPDFRDVVARMAALGCVPVDSGDQCDDEDLEEAEVE